jgi:hypothetical protein
MRVAVLISGRAARYEVCLYNILQKKKYDYDLFISVNDDPCEYYDIMGEKLSPWIRGLEVSPYTVPENFKNDHPSSIKQLVNGKFVPLNVLSMFYNDKKAFNMATAYADENKFEYDAYVKYRSDIMVNDFPEIIKSDEYKIYSAVPSCDFKAPIVSREDNRYMELVPIVCDAVAYGNRKSMEAYCDTYNYVLEINNLWRNVSNDYILNFEPCLTQNVYDKKVPVERFNYPYKLDGNRRIFDTVWSESGDSRVNNIRGAHSPINSKDVQTTEHIGTFPMS